MKKMRDWLRAWQLVAMEAVLLAIVWKIAPQQLGLVAYKAALITGAAVGAYAIDRIIFPYARPNMVQSAPRDVHAQYRRAIIIAAAMLAAGLAA